MWGDTTLETDISQEKTKEYVEIRTITVHKYKAKTNKLSKWEPNNEWNSIKTNKHMIMFNICYSCT